MGLREGIGEGLKAFGHANPAIAQIADQREQFDMKQKAAMAGLVAEGVREGRVDPKEAAQFFKNLGPEFEKLTIPGNAPPAELAGQGGGPPTPEQSEAQRTTIFGPDKAKPLNNELIKLQTQRDTLQDVLGESSGTQRKRIQGKIGELNARIAKITTIVDPVKGGIITPSQAGKEEVEMTTDEVNVRQNVTGMEEVIKRVASDDFIGGTAGDAVSVINSFAQQTKQLMGLDSIIKNGEIDETQLDLSPKNMARFRRAAINDDRVDSAILELAYIKAKSLDPGGRLSDADVRFAEKMLRSGADKASLINLLRDNQKRAIRNYNERVKVTNRRRGRKDPLLDIEDLLGAGAGTSSRSSRQIADSILESEGL